MYEMKGLILHFKHIFKVKIMMEVSYTNDILNLMKSMLLIYDLCHHNDVLQVSCFVVCFDVNRLNQQERLK